MTDPLTSDSDAERYAAMVADIVRPYVSKPDREGRVVRGVAPVRSSIEFRFVGPQGQVGRLLSELEHVYTLVEVSPPLPTKDNDGRVRVYGRIIRSARLGGAQ